MAVVVAMVIPVHSSARLASIPADHISRNAAYNRTRNRAAKAASRGSIPHNTAPYGTHCRASITAAFAIRGLCCSQSKAEHNCGYSKQFCSADSHFFSNLYFT